MTAVRSASMIDLLDLLVLQPLLGVFGGLVAAVGGEVTEAVVQA